MVYTVSATTINHTSINPIRKIEAFICSRLVVSEVCGIKKLFIRRSRGIS